MAVSGKTKVYGIIACPVEHSMSPLMQNFFAAEAGADLTYVPFRVEPEDLEDALRGLCALNVQGVNVTVPHKQRVIPYLSEIDDTAASIGAVNTLVRTDEGFKGFNTDAEGFLTAIRARGTDPAGLDCILIGAGGAARAAAFVLAREGANKIICLNRTLSRAERLMDDIGARFPDVEREALPLDAWPEIGGNGYLAVQTTSVGMTPDIGSSPIEDERFFEKLSFAMDVIYTPARTRFLKFAEDAGVPTCNGLDMLICQGMAAFSLWNPGLTLPAGAFDGARDIVTKFLEEGA